MIKADKEKAIIFLNKAIELDSSFIDKYKKESIFIPIKVYISNKENNNRIGYYSFYISFNNIGDLECNRFLDISKYFTTRLFIKRISIYIKFR